MTRPQCFLPAYAFLFAGTGLPACSYPVPSYLPGLFSRRCYTPIAPQHRGHVWHMFFERLTTAHTASVARQRQQLWFQPYFGNFVTVCTAQGGGGSFKDSELQERLVVVSHGWQRKSFDGSQHGWRQPSVLAFVLVIVVVM